MEHDSSDSLPSIVGEIIIPEQTTPSDLAALLRQKNFTIIADLMRLRVYKTVNEPLDFEIISEVARKYGFIAKRVV